MRLLKSLAFGLNIILAILFFFSTLSIFIDPQKLWIPAFLGLLFPLLFFANLFFLLLWIVWSRKKAGWSLLVLLISFPVSKNYFAFHSSPLQNSADAGSLRILSYNVRNFNLYQWTRDADALDEIIHFVQTQHPDILCLQEFYSADSGKFQTISAIKQKAALSHFFFQKTYEKKNGQAWGIAIFSRYPIIRQAQVAFDHKTSNSCCYVDVNVNGDTLRVFNIHLQSIYLSSQDYQFMQDVEQYQAIEENRVLPILAKLKQAFYYRSEQAKEIAGVIRQSPYPIIVCGDLNDSPASFAYQVLRANLNDAFLERGCGIGATYNPFLPLYRIDCILLDPAIEVNQFETYKVNFSDHYPVSATLELKKNS